MQKIICAIEKNLSDSDYSVEDLSVEVGISRSGLYKKMMFITGKSPIEFIRTMKLKKGRITTRRTDQSSALLVVIIMTPQPPRVPYIEAEASFNTSTDFMSRGFR